MLTPEEEKWLLENYNRLRLDELAATLGKHRSTIWYQLKKRGIRKMSDKVYMGNSLCWKCQHAVPNKEGTRGCSWSRKFEPVKGWKAVQGSRNYYPGTKIKTTSYTVLECPEFLCDEY